MEHLKGTFDRDWYYLMLYLCINKNDKDMKLVNTYSYYKEVPRTYDKSNNVARVFIEEYKTFYSVTVRFEGYACSSIYGLRVSKKLTNDPKLAAFGVIVSAYNKGLI